MRKERKREVRSETYKEKKKSVLVAGVCTNEKRMQGKKKISYQN